MPMDQKPPRRMAWWARFVPSGTDILTLPIILSVGILFEVINSAQAGILWFPIVAGAVLIAVWGAIVVILRKARME